MAVWAVNILWDAIIICEVFFIKIVKVYFFTYVTKAIHKGVFLLLQISSIEGSCHIVSDIAIAVALKNHLARCT